MADRNITEVYLLNVPLENDYRHTLYFPDQATQVSYFKDRIKQSYTDFSYQRKDSYIRVPAGYDSVVSMGVNYVMYRNKAYSNKWFYAFITNIVYKDDGRTDLYIETDVMQTWLFNHTVQASYIEREHCFNDDVGANTQPEDLETGEYVINRLPEYDPDGLTGGEGVIHYEAMRHGRGIIVGSTVDATNSPSSYEVTVDNQKVTKYHPYQTCIGGVYGGVFSGVKYFYFPNKLAAAQFINNADTAGQGDAITSVFMFPAYLAHMNDVGTELLEDTVPKLNFWGEDEHISNNVIKPSTIDGYDEVRNKKLLSYPYCYLMVTNNAGSENVYQYELFDTERCVFQIESTVTPGGSVRLTPLHYARANENYSKGMVGGKFPVCSWANDVYTNWLTQNGMNIAISTVRGQLAVKSANLGEQQAIVNGAATGAGSLFELDFGAAAKAGVDIAFASKNADIARANGYLDIKSVAAQKYQQSLTPPECKGNINSGDVTYAMGLSTFSAYHMSIKAEYARIIDRYFDMYGYATNLVKTPYKNHRESYWFIKTIAANVDAAIPNHDLNIIKRCYNNGITFWRHTKTVGDYTQSNNIVK